MEYKYYVNANEFYKDIVKVVPDFNLNKSLFLVDQSFYIKDKYVFAPYLNMTLNELNKIIGKDVFCSNKSQVFNEGYTIFYPLGISVLEGNVPVVEHIEVVEDVVVETPVEEDATKKVDWEWVESLKNTKSDKLKLDEYAEEFGINLNRANTISNMIKAFKKEL